MSSLWLFLTVSANPVEISRTHKYEMLKRCTKISLVYIAVMARILYLIMAMVYNVSQPVEQYLEIMLHVLDMAVM